MKKQNRFRSLLALALSLVMILAVLPVTAAEAASLGSDNVVYVRDGGDGDGSKPETPLGSLSEAFKAIGSDGGTIVLTGKVTQNGHFNTDGSLDHTGLILITGHDPNGTVYDDAELSYPKASNTDVGGPTVFEHLTINLVNEVNLNFYANTGMTFGDGLKTSGYPKKISIYGGGYGKDVVNSEIVMKSGEVNQIIALNRQDLSGKVTINISGGSVDSNITLGGNNLNVGQVEAIITGGSVNAIYGSGWGNGSEGSVKIQWLGGATNKGLMARSGSSNVTGDFNLILGKDFTYKEDTGGTKCKSAFTVGGTARVTFQGATGELLDLFDEFDALTLTGSSNATISGALPEGFQLTVEPGSKVKLAGYSQSQLDGAGITVSGGGEVEYGEEETGKVVYVNGSVVDGDGTTPEKAFSDLEKAFAALGGQDGTIVLTGPTAQGSFTVPAHEGTYKITGRYGGQVYENAELTFSAATNFDVGGPTVLENLAINLTKEVNVNFYANKSLTFGEGIVTKGYGSDKITLYGGVLSGSIADSALTVNSGAVKLVVAANKKPITGTASITINGGEITGYLSVGASAADIGQVEVTINGGAIKAIYPSGAKGSKTGSVKLALLGGTVTGGIKSNSKGDGPVTGDYDLVIGKDFAGAGSLSAVCKSTVTVGGEARVTFQGYVGELPNILGEFSALNLTDASNAICKSTLPEGYAIEVEQGSVLRLTEYTAETAGTGLKITGSGTVLYGPIPDENTPIQVQKLTVYLNGTVPVSGDGTTPETAVKTLDEAYKMLVRRYQDPNGQNLKDAGTEGTIIVCGDTTQAENFNLDAGYTHQGKLTITSQDGAVLHLGTAGGPVYLQMSGPTLWDDITVDALGPSGSTGETMFYTGYDFSVGEGFRTAWHGQPLVKTDKSYLIVLRCGFVDANDYDGVTPVNVKLMGGVWRSMNAGNHVHNISSVNLTLGGKGIVTSYIECGGMNSAPVGDITINIDEGGYSNALYLYSYLAKGKDAEMGCLTVNIRGTLFKLLPQRSSQNATATRKGDMIVNLYPTGSITGSSSNYTLENEYCTVTGKLVYNVYGYSGAAQYGMDRYDVVNLHGHTEPEPDYDMIPAGADHQLRVHCYSGSLNMDLSSFKGLSVAGNSDVTYMGAFPTELPIAVEPGSTLRIRPSQNPGKTLADFNYTGNVILAEPPYSAGDPVLSVDFENGVQDASGRGNHGTVHGSPAYVSGYDGGQALYITNPHGPAAQNYVLFENLKGIDLTTDSCTVLFWYKTLCGGNPEWARADYASTAGSGIDMSQALLGGIVFANQNTADPASPGMSAAQLTQAEFFAAGVTGVDGAHRDLDGVADPQDGRWHQVAVSYQRDGALRVYVDGELVKTVDISAFAGQRLGVNSLGLGADVLGQYGLGNAYIDDFQIYSGAMVQTDIQALYHLGRLKTLVAEAEQRLAQVGPEYTQAAKDTMAQAIQAAKAQLNGATAEDYAELMPAYDVLKAAFDAFLLSPTPRLSMLLLSDVHIGSAGDARAKALEQVLQDVTGLGLPLDGIVNAGDFADNATAGATDTAYQVLEDLLAKYGLTSLQMVASFGNHEINYESADENYLVSTARYWENLQRHIGENKQFGQGVGVLDDAWYEAGKHYCYGMTLMGQYHFLVLNTDYLTQTGSSKNVPDESGNELDPIRHGVHFDDETFEWIDKMMTQYSADGLPIFVINHFPFIDTVPLSYFDPVIVKDNSIGKQDAEIRAALAKYDNVVYFCGHLHSALGMSGPVQVTSEGVGSFTELNLPSLKSSSRGYQNIPANWIMFVYDTEIVLRARDFATGEWLTQYDAVIPLKGATPQGPTDPGTPGGSQQTPRPDAPAKPIRPNDPSSDVPRTGDTAKPLVLAAALPGSLAGIALVLPRKKKKI